MEYSITYEENHCGLGAVTTDGLYQIIHCTCQLETKKILRCYAICGEEILCLGVMEPKRGNLELTKRLSNRQWLPFRDGRLVLSEQQPNLENPWKPWQGNLYGREVQVALAQIRGEEIEIALPYSGMEPFPYMDLFVHLTPKKMGGKMYLTCMLPNP